MADTRTTGLTTDQPNPHRWLVLGIISLAQLMIVLDATVMNIALPSAQEDLGFSNDSPPTPSPSEAFCCSAGA
jgi:hypothetical protein